MKIHPLSISLGVLGAAAFFVAGVFVGRHWLSPRLTAGAQETEQAAPAPKRYRAVTKLQINPPSLAIGIPAAWFEQEFKTLTSHDLLKEVARKLHLETKWAVASGEASSRLERMVDAERERGTEIVNLSARSPDRDEAVQIANAVREAYAEQRRTAEEDAALSLKTLQDKIKLQESKVEEARMDMMDIMKKHNIVDMSPLGSVEPGVLANPAPGGNEPLTREHVEQEVSKMTMLLETLRDLKGEPLFAAFAKLDIHITTIDKIGTEYRAEMEQLAEATKALGPRHPKVRALTESTQSKFQLLEEAAAAFKANVEVQLKVCQKKLVDMAAKREEQSEYAKRKDAYVSQMLLLNSMREHAARVQPATPAPAPGRELIELLQEAKVVEP